MAKKSSVYFGPPLMALTTGLRDGDSVSGKLNRTAERYLDIIKRQGLDLDETEAMIIRNCLMGSVVEPLLIRHLADEVEDSEFMNTHPQTCKPLVERLRQASFADLVATIERLGF